MTEDSRPKASEESMADGTQVVRQRKKRKWDQPSESFLSAGLAVPGISLGSLGNLVGITLPGVSLLSGALVTNGLPATGATIAPIIQGSTIQQNAAAIVQKLNQPKIQDELIAREIVINDAEPTVRYKLTKRQTQEEIQKSTGAVVITRGKYRPPNGLPDNEKPLYLHISAGAHLKDTVERIKAVDHAAAMVEEIMKQGQTSQSVSTSPHTACEQTQVMQPLTTCVFLRFEPDPSLNVAARIRGPNDQYINHIMNETGAVVVLRGRGSGNVESPHGVDDTQQPLHLYLTSNNIRSLEAAKLLAENLLDTISAECGASRASSSRVYSAVPPPQQLLTGIPSSTVEQKTEACASATLASTTVGVPAVPANFPITISSVSSLVTPSVVSTTYQQVTIPPPGGIGGYGQPHTNTNGYPQLSLTRGTSYSGYGGIYPQATPLQQVALALKQAPPSAASVVPSTTSVANPLPNPISSITASAIEVDKRPLQKRKFQELPVISKGPTDMHQNLCPGSEFLKPGVTSEDPSMRNVSNMPPPKKLIQTDFNGMMLPPPRSMPPPPPPKFMLPTPPPPPKFMQPTPPPPKFTSLPPPPVPKFTTESLAKPLKAVEKTSMAKRPTANAVSDILTKLAEYGEEDDEDEENVEDASRSNSRETAASKPFWAV
ncbi:protein RIK isoform X2 [Aristolochia californica]|uniref:protein RIK isoform X2 n=1 Tax=Aristolochia californica TaxID=171875 RepID=UPI0035D58E7E